LGAKTDVKWLTPLPLWAGILGGPTAWALAHTINYTLVRLTCSRTLVLFAVLPAALAIVAAGAFAAFQAWRDTSSDGPSDGDHPRQRARFMALLGMTASAFFALAIVADAIPPLVLHACRN
jgi:hypothetical protein